MVETKLVWHRYALDLPKKENWTPTKYYLVANSNEDIHSVLATYKPELREFFSTVGYCTSIRNVKWWAEFPEKVSL